MAYSSDDEPGLLMIVEEEEAKPVLEDGTVDSDSDSELKEHIEILNITTENISDTDLYAVKDQNKSMKASSSNDTIVIPDSSKSDEIWVCKKNYTDSDEDNNEMPSDDNIPLDTSPEKQSSQIWHSKPADQRYLRVTPRTRTRAATHAEIPTLQSRRTVPLPEARTGSAWTSDELERMKTGKNKQTSDQGCGEKIVNKIPKSIPPKKSKIVAPESAYVGMENYSIPIITPIHTQYNAHSNNTKVVVMPRYTNTRREANRNRESRKSHRARGVRNDARQPNKSASRNPDLTALINESELPRKESRKSDVFGEGVLSSEEGNKSNAVTVLADDTNSSSDKEKQSADDVLEEYLSDVVGVPPPRHYRSKSPVRAVVDNDTPSVSFEGQLVVRRTGHYKTVHKKPTKDINPEDRTLAKKQAEEICAKIVQEQKKKVKSRKKDNVVTSKPSGPIYAPYQPFKATLARLAKQAEAMANSSETEKTDTDTASERELEASRKKQVSVKVCMVYDGDSSKDQYENMHHSPTRIKIKMERVSVSDSEEDSESNACVIREPPKKPVFTQEVKNPHEIASPPEVESRDDRVEITDFKAAKKRNWEAVKIKEEPEDVIDQELVKQYRADIKRAVDNSETDEPVMKRSKKNRKQESNEKTVPQSQQQKTKTSIDPSKRTKLPAFLAQRVRALTGKIENEYSSKKQVVSFTPDLEHGLQGPRQSVEFAPYCDSEPHLIPISDNQGPDVTDGGLCHFYEVTCYKYCSKAEKKLWKFEVVCPEQYLHYVFRVYQFNHVIGSNTRLYIIWPLVFKHLYSHTGFLDASRYPFTLNMCRGHVKKFTRNCHRSGTVCDVCQHETTPKQIAELMKTDFMPEWDQVMAGLNDSYEIAGAFYTINGHERVPCPQLCMTCSENVYRCHLCKTLPPDRSSLSTVQEFLQGSEVATDKDFKGVEFGQLQEMYSLKGKLGLYNYVCPKCFGEILNRITLRKVKQEEMH